MQQPIISKEPNFTDLIYLFDRNEPIYVTTLGWHKTPSLHTYGPAVRPYYLLHLIVDGKGEIEREGKIIKLTAGEAFLICPNEVTTYRADKDEPWEYYWISFYGDFSPTLIERTTSELCMPYQKSGLLALQTAFKNQTADTVGLLNTLFSVLDSIRSKAQKREHEPDAVATALHYLENNFFRDIDVQTLASQLGFSRAYFSTMFQEKTGESPYRYLLNVRIRKAKEYLISTTQTVEQTAYSVGFSCIGRFCELFKKYTGLSPLQYRKQFSKTH